MDKWKRTRTRRNRRPVKFEIEMPTRRVEGKGHYRYTVPETVTVTAKRSI